MAGAGAAGAQDPRLVILPGGDNLVRPVGTNVVLTCKSKIPDPELISELRWLGPNGQEIVNGNR